MRENINYTYESKPIDTAVLSVLDVISDGKIVSAADWTALWNAVLVRINHIDEYCSNINALTIDWQKSVAAFEKAVTDINIVFNTLSNSFIHYGEEAPTDEHTRLWVQPSSEIDAKSLVNKAALISALINKADKLERITDLIIYPELPEGITQFIADSNIVEIVFPTIDVGYGPWSALMGNTIPKDSVITVYHLIKHDLTVNTDRHTFYLKTNTHWYAQLGEVIKYGYYIFDIRVKDNAVVESTYDFVEGNTEFPNIPKVSQSFNPNSEDAQSGIAVAEAIEPVKEELGEVTKSICRWKSGTYYEVGDAVLVKYGTDDKTSPDIMLRCIKEHTSSKISAELDTHWVQVFQAASAVKDSAGNNIASTYLQETIASKVLLSKKDAADIYAPLTIVPNFKLTKIPPRQLFPIKPNMLIMAMGEDAERCIELYGNNETKISNANMFLSFSVASNEAIEGDGYIASRVRVGCLYYENALSSGIKNYYIYKPVIKNTSSNKSVYIYYVEQG